MRGPINIMAMTRVLKMGGGGDFATMAVRAFSKKGGVGISTEQAEIVGDIFNKAGFGKQFETPEGMAKVIEKINNAMDKAAEAGGVAGVMKYQGDIEIGAGKKPDAIQMKQILSERNNELLKFGGQIGDSRRALSHFSTDLTAFSFKVLAPSIKVIGDALKTIGGRLPASSEPIKK